MTEEELKKLRCTLPQSPSDLKDCKPPTLGGSGRKIGEPLELKSRPKQTLERPKRKGGYGDFKSPPKRTVYGIRFGGSLSQFIDAESAQFALRRTLTIFNENIQVQPADPDSMFTDYFISVTPISKKVYSVRAEKSLALPGACIRDKDILILELSKEFGKSHLALMDGGEFMYNLPDITIIGGCYQNRYISDTEDLRIVYIDNELHNVRADEKHRFETKPQKGVSDPDQSP